MPLFTQAEREIFDGIGVEGRQKLDCMLIRYDSGRAPYADKYMEECKASMREILAGGSRKFSEADLDEFCQAYAEESRMKAAGSAKKSCPEKPEGDKQMSTPWSSARQPAAAAGIFCSAAAAFVLIS